MTNPLSLSCLLLILGIPFVGFLGTRLTGRLSVLPPVRRLVAPAVSLSAWLVAVVTVGRLSGSFVTGLWTGTLITAALGAAVRYGPGRTRQATPQHSLPGDWRAMVISGLLLTAPVAFLAFQGDFFDEFVPTGHRGQVAQLQNDTFPPRHIVFPEFPLRYHYGFNVVAATLTAITRVPVALALDILVIAGFFWSWCLAWRLGQRLLGHGTGIWAALGALYGGGAFYWLLLVSDWTQHPALGPVIGDNRVNFPVIMYFFQKPFALGFPLALALLLVISSRDTDRWNRSLSIALLLGALSIVQTVLFVTLTASLTAHELLRERNWRSLVAPGLALLMAAAMGGVLFTRLPDGGTVLIRFRFWPTANTPGEILAWYGLTSGLLIPLGLMGLRVITELRLPLLLLAAGSFVTPMFFTNPFAPWDMLKFATVGQFAFGLVGGCALAALAATGGRWRRFLALGLLALLVASGFGHAAAWAREVVEPTSQLGRTLKAQRTLKVKTEWDELIAWSRSRERRTEATHADDPRLRRQLALAGVPVSGPPRLIDREFGVSSETVEARRRLLGKRPKSLRAWHAQGISLFALQQSHIAQTDKARARWPLYGQWAAAGQLREVKRFGSWALFEVDVSQLGVVEPSPGP